MCAWFGCIHSSQPAASMIGAGQPVVVGVRVRADQQAHVLEAQAGLVERALELAQAARLVEAGVDQHHAVAAAIANAFTCGTPGQGSGSRSRQSPGSTRSARASSRLRALTDRPARPG